MSINLKCPRCGQLMTLDVATGTVECRGCGYVPLFDSNAAADAPPTQRRPIDLPNVPLSSQRRPSARQEALFRDGMQALKEGRREEARQRFMNALELDKRFIDPWLWLVSTTDDPAEQRHYLEWALAYEPDNLKAVEAIAVIDGRLDADDLRADSPRRLRRLDPDQPVTAKADTTQCPQCGGHLLYDIAGGAVVCAQCNYRKVIAVESADPRGTLVEAMLKRKYARRNWEETRRVLTCANCGAETTLLPRAMTDRCFFCDSQRVVVSDSAETFEQPDAIIPFGVTEEQAAGAVFKAMNTGLRALTRRFRDPSSHHDVHGIYIPYWAFDGLVTVVWRYPGPVEDSGEYPYMFDNVLACASSTLDRALLARIEPFELKRTRRYDPRYLANMPAEVYRLDVDEASLNARAKMSQRARERLAGRLSSSKRVTVSTGYGAGSDRTQQTVRLMMSTQVSDITYRLVLLPVWNMLLHEVDGDIRRALVNGQTGKVALSGPLGGLF